MNTDRIEKKIVLRASLERVWNAISDAKQFGSWFGVDFDGSFVEGAHLPGRIVPTTVDRIAPMRRLSFRWHPFAVEPNIDYSKEPTTIIVFELQEVADGILLTI